MVRYWIAVVAAALLCFVGSGAAVFLLLPPKDFTELVGPFEEPRYVEGRFQEGKAQLDKAFPNGLGPFAELDRGRPEHSRDIFGSVAMLGGGGLDSISYCWLLPVAEWEYLGYANPGEVEAVVSLDGGWMISFRVPQEHRTKLEKLLSGLLANGYSIEWEE